MDEQMRINLARKQSGLQQSFMKVAIKEFAADYEFQSISIAETYVSCGKQGLEVFAEFLRRSGYAASTYYLDPNKDLLKDVGNDYSWIIRTSPSFGILIDDSDPKLVEFKMRNG